MKGMSFGEGTSYKSPQLMKKESAMKMKKEAAMKLKQRDGSTTPGKRDVATKEKYEGRQGPKKEGGSVSSSKGLLDKAAERVGAKSSFKKKAKHETSGKSNVGKHQGYDLEAGQKAIEDHEKGKKYYDEAKASGKSHEESQKIADTNLGRDAAYAGDKNLSNLVKERDRLKATGDTSSKEYQEIQNRINASYGNEKRHGETITTSGKEGDRSRTTTKHTPGIGTTETKTVYDKDGNKKKVKSTKRQDDYYGGEVTKTKLKGEDAKKDLDLSSTSTSKSKKSKNTKAEATKQKKRKQFKDTKVGQTKVGQLFVKKNRRNKK